MNETTRKETCSERCSEKCSECSRQFSMTEYNARYVQDKNKTKALCGSCAEDSPMLW